MKNETICAHCQRPFWAWDTNRTKCYQCDPPPKWQAKELVAAIKSGELHL